MLWFLWILISLAFITMLIITIIRAVTKKKVKGTLISTIVLFVVGFICFIGAIISIPSDSGDTENNNVSKTDNENGKTNKSKAVEVDFIKFNDSGYKHEQPLKISDGQVKSVGENELGMETALVQRKEKDGYASYNIVNWSDDKLKKDDTYTFYGTNDLKNEEGHPTIDVNSIEQK